MTIVPVCISRGHGGFPSATGVIHVRSPVLKIQISPKVPCMPAPPKTSCIKWQSSFSPKIFDQHVMYAGLPANKP